MLGKIICIMKMYQPFFMGFPHFRWKQETLCNILADFPCHIVPLGRRQQWIFIGILLLDIFILTLNNCHNLPVRCVGLAHKLPPVTVCDVSSCHMESACLHDSLLHLILDFLYPHSTDGILTHLFHLVCNLLNLFCSQTVSGFHFLVGFVDRRYNFCDVKYDFLSASLYDFQFYCLPYKNAVGKICPIT